jgi:hypothetical protein
MESSRAQKGMGDLRHHCIMTISEGPPGSVRVTGSVPPFKKVTVILRWQKELVTGTRQESLTEISRYRISICGNYDLNQVTNPRPIIKTTNALYFFSLDDISVIFLTCCLLDKAVSPESLYPLL